MKTWIPLAGAAALAAAFFAPAANAGTSVHVQIGTPYYGGHYYAQPGYVVTSPQYYYAPRNYYHGNYGYGYHRPHRGDRDGDGIRNRYDRDRDGDGVSNRRDRRPNNPYRY